MKKFEEMTELEKAKDTAAWEFEDAKRQLLVLQKSAAEDVARYSKRLTEIAAHPEGFSIHSDLSFLRAAVDRAMTEIAQYENTLRDRTRLLAILNKL